MKHVLVTGATGTLGRELLKHLLRAGHEVIALSRRPPDTRENAAIEWRTADLGTDEGLEEATAGVDTIIHAATSPVRRPRRVDEDGTRRLVEAAEQLSVSHFIYPSIIGIDRARYPYYLRKLAAERAIETSGLPHSIIRIAKFHPFVHRLIGAADRLPVMLLPTDFRDQPIDPSEVAEHLVKRVASGPGGRLTDLAGPEILTYRELAQQWLQSRGRPKRIIRLPIPGEVAHEFRRGATTNTDAIRGNITWAQWLRAARGSLAETR